VGVPRTNTGEKQVSPVAETRRGDRSSRVENIFVARIRPEEGLGRKRDREGHRELQRSIERFGVLTPITVRRAPDDSGDYLLIKGQGRTLACRLLGVKTIPAIVVDDEYAENEKVQQFLVENVARLKMRPVDRALLIYRARQEGEETTDIARRFGVSAVTVRRLLAQLEGASSNEVATLRAGEVSLAVHAVVARHVSLTDRARVLEVIAGGAPKAKELEALFVALGWRSLEELGARHREQRLTLLRWACAALEHLPPAGTRERLRQLALRFPIAFEKSTEQLARVPQ
jgi:ParB/RepB/Spo0J family partition protein